MRRPLGLALGLALVVAGAVLFLMGRREALEPGPDRAALDPAAAAPASGEALAGVEGDAEREAVELAPPTAPTAAGSAELETAEAPPPEPAATSLVRGRVLDVRGEPLSAVAVAFDDDRAKTARSDASGAFRLERADPLPPSGSEVVVVDERYATVCASVVRERNLDREHLVVGARAVRLAGRVVDQGGVGLAGATVRIGAPESVLRSFPHPLDMTRRKEAVAATAGEGGRFELGRAPVLEGGWLGAAHAGYEGATAPIPEVSRDDLVLELAALDPADAEPAVEGVVLLPDRTPAAGARVSTGVEDAFTDERGRFRLPYPSRADADDVLAAGKHGYAPAIVADFGALSQAARPHPPGPLTLVLGERLDLAGVVVDAEGAPLAGWTVQLTDGTPLTGSFIPPPTAERLAGETRVATGEDGTFRLSGLAARDYVVLAYDPGSLLTVRSEPTPAGSEDLVLRVPEDATWPRVAGRVVSRRGRPVAGVTVRTKLVTYRASFGTSWQSGRDFALTNEEGRFELRDVPRAEVVLELGGEGIVPADFELAEGARPEDLRIEVAERCHLRVELDPGDSAGVHAAIEDAAGERLTIYRFQAGGWTGSTMLRLERDGVDVLAVSEDAHTLVLSRPGFEDQRIPLTLDPEGVNELRPPPAR